MFFLSFTSLNYLCNLTLQILCEMPFLKKKTWNFAVSERITLEHVVIMLLFSMMLTPSRSPIANLKYLIPFCVWCRWHTSALHYQRLFFSIQGNVCVPLRCAIVPCLWRFKQAIRRKRTSEIKKVSWHIIRVKYYKRKVAEVWLFCGSVAHFALYCIRKKGQRCNKYTNF